MVELMIVGGLLGGLALVVMNLTKTSSKSTTKFQFDTETNLITNELVGVLSSPSKCLAALGGRNALSTSSGITNINGQYYISSHVSAPENGYGNGGVKISSYTLSSTPTEVTANTGYLNIIYANKKILGGQPTVTKKIKLYIEVDGGNLITACNSMASDSALWIKGTGTNIYYVGNVGIRTTSPTYPLVVQNSLGAGNTLAAQFRTTTSYAGIAFSNAGTSVSPAIFSNNNDLAFYTGNTEKIRISQSGDFTIWHSLYMPTMPSVPTSQYMCWTGSGLIGNCGSTIRLKKNIRDLEDGLSTTLKMRPVRFQWKENSGDEIGFIAEEMNQVEPVLTIRDKKNQISGIKHQEITAIVVQAIKELYSKLQVHDHRLEKAQLKIKELEHESLKLKKIICLDHPNEEICKN